MHQDKTLARYAKKSSIRADLLETKSMIQNSYNDHIAKLESITTREQLQERHTKHLGKSSPIQEAFKWISKMSPEEKKDMGPKLAEAKKALTSAYEAKDNDISTQEINQKLNDDIVDITLPTKPLPKWHYSLLTQTRREIEDICERMWFHIYYGEDVVTKFENFTSVNIPLTHPATEMHDSFYLEETDSKGEHLMLRTHTSAMQNSIIKELWVPCKAVVPAKVFRNENTDATHDTTFYQLEWIVIDKGINIGHMKSLMTDIMQALFQAEVEIRMRPAYFPFVEPGVEMDARYAYTDTEWNKQRSKRMEIVGAGMIHPNVLEQAGVDPKEYTWFAFGFGINRIVGIRHTIKDIRLFTNGDLRFVRSF